MQWGVAAYATLTLDTSPQQIWELDAGSGKTWTASAVGLMLLSTKRCTSLQYVVPNPGLKKRDSAEFRSYWDLGGYTEKVEYHSDIDFIPKKNGVVLIDEADVLIFRDPKKFSAFFKKARVICFTASPPAGGKQSLESDIYSQLGLKSFAYLPASLKLNVAPTPLHRLKPMTTDELVAYTSDRAKEQAVLVYTTEARAQIFLSRVEGAELVTADDSADSLRQLNIKPAGTLYRILLITDEMLMRGYDYRGHERGLTLILDQSFESQRDVDQGLARVGRYGEKCHRFITHSTPEIDGDRCRELTKRLINFQSAGFPTSVSNVRKQE